MNISLICFTRDGFETMKRINDTLSGASEAFANASCPEHRDRSAKTEDRSCEGGTLYQSLWIAGRYALQLAATDAGVPYQAVPEGGLSEWTKEAFLRDDALIFVGACGIAVRSIAPYVRDKFQDPAVVCVDEAGQFVIPLLSGHVGGANRLAETVSFRDRRSAGGDNGDGCGEEICGGRVRKGSWICDHGPETCKGDFS